MKKIFLASLVILFISGCAATDSMKGLFGNLPGIKPSSSGGGKSFVGGTDSILINILQPVESSKISKDVPLRVSVNLKNNGESDAEGQLCVTGLNPEIFEESQSCDCQDFSLKGKTRFQDETSDGEDSTFSFDEGSPVIDEFTINDFSVTSIVRYDYKTYASVEGCVRKDLLKSKDCKPRQDVKVLGVSSAPMQITSVTQELLSTSEEDYTMTLLVDISHSGKGQFFDSSFQKDACVEENGNVNKKVDVKLYNAPGSVTCTPMVMKKDENKGTAVCIITGVSSRDYNPLVNIELSYTYELRESNNFEVA